MVMLQRDLTLTWGEATYLKSRAVAHDDEGVRGVEEVSVGGLARRSLLSVKALRLYDELGVLKPPRALTMLRVIASMTWINLRMHVLLRCFVNSSFPCDHQGVARVQSGRRRRSYRRGMAAN